MRGPIAPVEIGKGTQAVAAGWTNQSRAAFESVWMLEYGYCAAGGARLWQAEPATCRKPGGCPRAVLRFDGKIAGHVGRVFDTDFRCPGLFSSDGLGLSL